jgi:chromosome partitioning protein
LIPITPEPFAVNGLARLIKVTDKIKTRLNPTLELDGILVTKFEKRVIINQQTLEILREHFGSKVYNTIIHKNIALVESTSVKQSIFKYAPDSSGAKDYELFCKEFMDRQ